MQIGDLEWNKPLCNGQAEHLRAALSPAAVGWPPDILTVAQGGPSRFEKQTGVKQNHEIERSESYSQMYHPRTLPDLHETRYCYPDQMTTTDQRNRVQGSVDNAGQGCDLTAMHTGLLSQEKLFRDKSSHI